MSDIRAEIITGTIFCKDGTIRVIRGILRNYMEVGRYLEGDNYGSSTIDSTERNRFELDNSPKARRTLQELLELKAEKKAFKQVLRLKHPDLVAQGLSAEQIWNKTCSRSGKTN